MNEELAQTVKIVNDLMENGINFVMEKYPELYSEIIYIGLIKNSLAMLVFMFVWLLCMYILIKRVWPDMQKQHNYDDCSPHFAVMIIFQLPLTVVLPAFFTLLYILVAPNLYVYQQLMSTF